MTGSGAEALGPSAMVVVTPTYAPDRELFADLHASVLASFPEDVAHLVVTPERDLASFRAFEGARCSVVSVREALPTRLWELPRNAWVLPRRPVPPIRGWIVQQLVKLAVAARSPGTVVVLADADVVFVRPVTAETFAPGGAVRFYRVDRAVDESLPRHVRWHAVARRMLGLPPEPRLPLPDYISALNTWDPDRVRACLARVEEVGGRPWIEIVSRQLHFSEFILYGVYCDAIAPADAAVTSAESGCLFHWDEVPLTPADVDRLARSLAPEHVAVMISAKSRTPLDLRRRLIAELRG